MRPGRTATTTSPDISRRRMLSIPTENVAGGVFGGGKRGGRRPFPVVRSSALLLAALLLVLLPSSPPSPSAVLLLPGASAHGGASSAPSGSIPRSTSHRLSLSDRDGDVDLGGDGDGDGDSSPDDNDSSGGSRTAAPRHPPWNRSPRIDPDGFLSDLYRRIPGEWEPEADIGGRHGPSSRSYRALSSGSAPPAVVRQVPGDGNCLFHSVSAALYRASNGTHPPLCTVRGLRSLRRSSADLRARAVECLSRDPRRRLFLQGRETLRAGELVDAAAAQYGLTGREYCEQMGRDSYWGGGPEIVALCNVLRRPIHVYELCSVEEGEDGGGGGGGGPGEGGSALAEGGAGARSHPPSSSFDEEEEDDDDGPGDSAAGAGGQRGKKRQRGRDVHSQFRLRRMACFGSPRYDRREPLHILSADSRFPDVVPGRHLATGNHFLAVFPESTARKRSGEKKKRDVTGRPRKVRGGGGAGGGGAGAGAGAGAAGRAEAEARARARSGRADGGGGGGDGKERRRRRDKKPILAPRSDDDDRDDGNLFGRIGRWVHRMDRSGGHGLGRGRGRGRSGRNGGGGPPGGRLAASLVERWLDLLGRLLAVI